jgi:nanoRNase/pAp phosphatase (c-di-AMP/oligoRNAs hydrolase)
MRLYNASSRKVEEFTPQNPANVKIYTCGPTVLVEGVDVAVAIKTYPDGKLTGKIRSASPVAEQLAGFFGGGGHPYAAGFRVYESYDVALPEIIKATNDILSQQI